MRVRLGSLSSYYLQPPPQRAVAKPRRDPWAELEWWQHPAAIRAVAEHPEGMTLEQIGREMGVTRERVRQIEAVALRKLKECGGVKTITAGRFEIAIPDCELCQLPFVRMNGRTRLCDGCTHARAHRRSRRHHH